MVFSLRVTSANLATKRDRTKWTDEAAAIAMVRSRGSRVARVMQLASNHRLTSRIKDVMRGRVWMCGALQERTWVVVDTDVWADGLCICSLQVCTVYMSLSSSGQQCSGVAEGRWQICQIRWWSHGTCVPDTMGQRRGVHYYCEERWALVVVVVESGGCALLW